MDVFTSNNALLTRGTLGVLAALFCVCAMPQAGFAGEEGGGVGVELGFSTLDEDSYLVPRLEGAYTWSVPALACEGGSECQTALSVAGQLPVRLRLIDRRPSAPGLIREADWDELGDWFRVVRRIQYGRPDEPLYAQMGPLGPTSLGHGTILRDYYNVVSEDHFQLGVATSLNTAFGGIELLLDDAIEPSLFGTRVYFRPAAFFGDESWAERIAVGGSLVVDARAPTDLLRDVDGNLVVEDTLEPQVIDSTNSTLIGADVEVTVFDGPSVSVVPYVDFNTHVGFGHGLHAGSFVRFKHDDTLAIELRGEYRQTWRRYIAGYVGPLYEVDRFSFSGWGLELDAPQAKAAASIPPRVRMGAAGGVKVDVSDITSVELAYADHGEGRNERLRARVVATPHERVQLGAFYYKQNFGPLSNAFDLDGVLLATEARVDVYSPIYVFGTYGRSWSLGSSDGFETVDDWEVGVGASWRL